MVLGLENVQGLQVRRARAPACGLRACRALTMPSSRACRGGNCARVKDDQGARQGRDRLPVAPARVVQSGDGVVGRHDQVLGLKRRRGAPPTRRGRLRRAARRRVGRAMRLLCVQREGKGGALQGQPKTPGWVVGYSRVATRATSVARKRALVALASSLVVVDKPLDRLVHPFLERRELEVGQVFAQLAVACRLLELSVRLGGVELVRCAQGLHAAPRRW